MISFSLLFFFFLFQYVTLFASAFPLCSMITILFLFIEARSDMFKLLYLCRRPIVHRYDVIYFVLCVTSFIVIIGACLLKTFWELVGCLLLQFIILNRKRFIDPSYGKVNNFSVQTESM